MEKIPIHIIALAHNEGQDSSYLVILKEEEGERRLPVSIGSYEAQAIAAAVEGKTPALPLTHDLLSHTMQRFGVALEEVIISALRDHVFFSTLVCRSPEGAVFELDSRTSDALALAIRFSCPIFTNMTILNEAGIYWENDGPLTHKLHTKSGLGGYSEEELEQLLQDAIDLEDYQKAATIRDELNKRKSN